MLASHDHHQVQRLCDRVLWLSEGSPRAYGTPDEVYEEYAAAMRSETERRATAAAGGPEGPDGFSRFGTAEVEIAAVRVLPDHLKMPGAHDGSPVRIEVDLVPHAPVEDPIVGVSLHRVSDGLKVLDVSTDTDGVRLGRVAGPTSVTIAFDRLDCEPGKYRFDVGVYAAGWACVYDYHWQAYTLELLGPPSGFGPARRWSAGAG